MKINRAAITLLMVTLILVTIGVVMLFSTSALPAKERYGDAYYLLKRQLVWLAVGGIGCVFAASVPYPKLRGAVPVLLGAAAVLLLAVLIPYVGHKVGGARRWLSLPGMQLQPSELGKLVLIVWLAHYLSKEKRRLDEFKRGYLIPMAVTGGMLLLVLAEPDFGSTALMASVAFAMMYIAGVRLRYLGPTILSGLVGFSLLIMHNPVRMKRMLAFTDLDKYKAGVGYQVWQGMLAFGSGGFSGLGLGNSRQKMFYLPEAHTDFIFPIVGEELGLVGTLAILAAFMILVACGMYISLNASDLFGQYLGMGCTLLLAMQALINIGVVTAWLPTKGLPLPFISYGGSNVVMNLVAVGLLLNIYRRTVPEMQPEVQEFFASREQVS